MIMTTETDLRVLVFIHFWITDESTSKTFHNPVNGFKLVSWKLCLYWKFC